MNRSTAIIALPVALILSACGSAPDDGPQEKMDSPELAQVERICDLPAGSLSGQAPVPDAMPKIVCAAEEAHKRGLTVGFISNPVDPNAQTQ